MPFSEGHKNYIEASLSGTFTHAGVENGRYAEDDDGLPHDSRALVIEVARIKNALNFAGISEDELASVEERYRNLAKIFRNPTTIHGMSRRIPNGISFGGARECIVEIVDQEINKAIQEINGSRAAVASELTAKDVLWDRQAILDAIKGREDYSTDLKTMNVHGWEDNYAPNPDAEAAAAMRTRIEEVHGMQMAFMQILSTLPAVGRTAEVGGDVPFGGEEAADNQGVSSRRTVFSFAPFIGGGVYIEDIIRQAQSANFGATGHTMPHAGAVLRQGEVLARSGLHMHEVREEGARGYHLERVSLRPIGTLDDVVAETTQPEVRGAQDERQEPLARAEVHTTERSIQGLENMNWRSRIPQARQTRNEAAVAMLQSPESSDNGAASYGTGSNRLQENRTFQQRDRVSGGSAKCGGGCAML